MVIFHSYVKLLEGTVFVIMKSYAAMNWYWAQNLLIVMLFHPGTLR